MIGVPDAATLVNPLNVALVVMLPFASLTTIPLAALVVTPSAVTTPVPVVIVDGAEPAPPPTTKALDANAADDAQVVPLEKYGTPPEVPATVSASVPEVVTGDPVTETMPPVKVCPTLVTVPEPLVAAQLITPAVVLVKA
jgi:hypothetical protein